MNSTMGIDDDAFELLPTGTYMTLSIANLVLCSISVVLAAVLIVAMIFPLLCPKKRAHYSNYNLYLAYMAIPDMIANAFVMSLLLAENNRGHWMGETDIDGNTPMFDVAFGHSTFLFCMTGSLYINSFLAYEIYRLLKSSNDLKRHSPPTILRVTTQAMTSYGLGVSFFAVDYWKTVQDMMQGEQWKIIYEILTVVLVGLIPSSVLVVVCILICKQKLIHSTRTMYEGPLRVLFVYFARIIFVSMLHWLPACIAYMISWTQEEVNSTKIIAFHVAVIFGASQGIVTVAFSLTKPDARQHILDLFKCVYCLQCCRRAGRSTDDDSYFDDPYLRSNLPTTNLFSIIFSNQSSAARNSREGSADTVTSEKSDGSSHQKHNADWKDEEANSEHPRKGSSSRNNGVEEV